MEFNDFQKIQILLAEYTSLRSEIIARIGHIYQVAGIGTLVSVAGLFMQVRGPSFNLFAARRERRTAARVSGRWCS
jgi:hypothetical protein